MEQEKKENNKKHPFSSPLLIILSLFVGIWVGASNIHVFGMVQSILDRKGTSDVSDLTLFWRVWSLVDARLPGADSVSSEERIYGAIKGMLTSFDDPYTTFFTPDENEIFQGEIQGSFSGIGVEIAQRNGVLVVVAPLKDAPAYKAGILPEDRIISIDGVEITQENIHTAIARIRGEKGTPVILQIISKGQDKSREVQIIRDTITIPTLSRTYDSQTGIYTISLYNFSEQSAPLFEEAMRDFKQKNARLLLIDLRNNPGGYLESSIKIASHFLPEGTPIVRERGKKDTEEVVHRAQNRVFRVQPEKIAILVNAGSASASEIVAGALSEHKKAVLIGEKTFGKGSVQEVIPLQGGGALKVTIAKWFTPNGVSLSEGGIVPSKIVEQEKESGRDTQKEAAVRYLLER